LFFPNKRKEGRLEREKLERAALVVDSLDTANHLLTHSLHFKGREK